MPPRSTVYDLARQLLRVADDAVLDAPLEQLADSVRDDVVRESLDDLVRAGFADSLRAALDDDRLDRFAAERCTQREEEALCRTLQQLLGRGPGTGGNDHPSRLVQVDLPPQDAISLARWARAHGVEALIAQAAEEDVAAAVGLPPGSTVGACYVQAAEIQSSASPLAGDDAMIRVRAQLHGAASAQAATEARRQLWQRKPSPDLKGLATRLVAMLDTTDASNLAELAFIPAHPVTIDVGTGVARGQLSSPDNLRLGVRVFLSGHEQRGLLGACEACGDGRCQHVQALAGRLLDGALDPQDRLHSALCRVASEPSWQRFVKALQPEASGAPAATDKGQLSFRLHREGQQLAVGVHLHKPMRAGGYSTGRQLSIASARHSGAVCPQDRAVLDAMALGSRPLSTTRVVADPLILRALSEHPRVRLGDGETSVRVAETTFNIVFREHGDGLLPEVFLGGVRVPSEAPHAGRHYLLHHDGPTQTLFFAPLAPAVRRLLTALSAFRGVLPPESFQAIGPWLVELRQVATVEAPAALAGMEHQVARKLLLRLSEGPGEAVQAALSARPLPLGALWPPGQGPQVVHGLVGGQQSHARRDLDRERLAAKEVLTALDLGAHARLEPFVYRVEGTQATLALMATAAKLGDLIDVEWSERARRLTLAPTVRSGDLKVRLFKRGHWLEAEGGVLSGQTEVAVGRLLEAARRGERFVRVGGDTYAAIEEALRTKLEASQLYAIDLRNVVRLAAAAGPGWLRQLGDQSAGGDADTRAWLKRAAQTPETIANVATAAPLPESFVADLRPYQRAGVAWLTHMTTWAPGACLADEMGLGKTVQAIALLCHRAHAGPALVVAPTSVNSNWAIELERFAPSLTTHTYRGAKRAKLLPQLRAGHVVIMSYELLQRDAQLLSPITFATQIVDEAQWVKNARTQRARAVRDVRADFRLALSGTPVENRLGDLWSLYALIAPGLFGKWSRFRALFAVPIERYDDRARRAHLRALASPFALRRTKGEVATDLPSRTEVIHRIELTQPERELYQAATGEARANLRKRRQQDAPRTTHVLADLTRLRQLACHPRLVLQQPEAESSKLAALLTLLDDILPRGHRALVFSQFVQHLGLVREALDQRGTDYLYLDGSTPAGDRQTLVERFQGGGPPLFLISLKAGGTGLNLTAADYVIQLDPWWNPAAEDQASDRAHRLGQQRPVTIVKLVTADTIEERVLALHTHKRELADSLFGDRATPAARDLAALDALLEGADPA